MRKCKYCGSQFPHLRFSDSCEWTTNKDDMALQCDCGSVKWSILKTGEIECAKCTVKADYRAERGKK